MSNRIEPLEYSYYVAYNVLSANEMNDIAYHVSDIIDYINEQEEASTSAAAKAYSYANSAYACLNSIMEISDAIDTTYTSIQSIASATKEYRDEAQTYCAKAEEYKEGAYATYSNIVGLSEVVATQISVAQQAAGDAMAAAAITSGKAYYVESLATQTAINADIASGAAYSASGSLTYVLKYANDTYTYFNDTKEITDNINTIYDDIKTISANVNSEYLLAKEAAVSANTSANIAKGHAQAAENHSIAASASRDDAHQYSVDASRYADTARNAVASAQAAANDANNFRQGALEFKDIAENAATRANDSAVAAKNSETNAKSSETNTISKYEAVVGIQRSIDDKYNQINSLHTDVVSKHDAVQSMHRDVSIWHGETANCKTEAVTAATNANNAATRAEEFANTANAAVAAASRNASDAAESAGKALGYANAASLSANNASTYAGDAANSAYNAQYVLEQTQELFDENEGRVAALEAHFPGDAASEISLLADDETESAIAFVVENKFAVKSNGNILIYKHSDTGEVTEYEVTAEEIYNACHKPEANTHHIKVLTANVDAGMVIVNFEQGVEFEFDYTEGDTCSIVCQALVGYKFSHWGDNLDSSFRSVDVSLDAESVLTKDRELVAVFTEDSLTEEVYVNITCTGYTADKKMVNHFAEDISGRQVALKGAVYSSSQGGEPPYIGITTTANDNILLGNTDTTEGNCYLHISDRNYEYVRFNMDVYQTYTHTHAIIISQYKLDSSNNPVKTKETEITLNNLKTWKSLSDLYSSSIPYSDRGIEIDPDCVMIQISGYDSSCQLYLDNFKVTGFKYGASIAQVYGDNSSSNNGLSGYDDLSNNTNTGSN